jgi:hypothetical protein
VSVSNLKPAYSSNATSKNSAISCAPPNDGHSSFDKDCPTRTKENIITRMKIDRGISYGMARKIFEEKIQASKKTYAEIAGKFIDDLARDEANELKILRKKS